MSYAAGSYPVGKVTWEVTSCRMSQSQHSVCRDACLQPYLAKAEAWRKLLRYGRAAHSSDGFDERKNRHARHIPTDTPTGPFVQSGAVMPSYHTHALVMKA